MLYRHSFKYTLIMFACVKYLTDSNKSSTEN